MWVIRSFLFGVVATWLVLASDWMDCPEGCQCKWSTGKKSAFCSNAHFTTIPDKLHPEVQVLDLSGNRIPYLNKDAFISLGLMNLQRIKMRNSGVRELHSGAFKQLTILIEVDLSNNSIATLHKDTFAGNTRLKVLYLNGNNLTELHEAQFPHLPHLKTLEMQHCQISKIHKDAFIHLPSLEILSLNNNRLRQLSENVFLPVPSLKSLSLDGNLWTCDCNLRGFRNWLISSNLYSHSLLCLEPSSLASRQWEAIIPDAFSCPPSVHVSEAMLQEEPGENVTLKCRVTGDPEPEVAWFFNGRTMGNTSTEQFLVKEEREGEVKAEKWNVLSIMNVSEEDAGEYTCVAGNIGGQAAANVSLILPEVVIATTVAKNETWWVWAVWAGSGLGLILLLSLTACLACRLRGVRGRNSARKMKGSESYTDQDKKLLDVSITTTTDRQTGSCEGLASQAEMELLEQSIQSIPLELSAHDPVQITIESHGPHSHSHGHGHSHGGEQAVPVYQPPPEFSANLLPQGRYGNIFISVSVPSPPIPGEMSDTPRYPDLLDLPHRKSVSVSTEPPPYFATLPKRRPAPHLKETEPVLRVGPQYDNMGPRVTAAGSSTISLPDCADPDEIPPPPPPPNCTPLTVEYVSL